MPGAAWQIKAKKIGLSCTAHGRSDVSLWNSCPSHVRPAACYVLRPHLSQAWGIIRSFMQNSGNTMQHVAMWASRLLHKLEDSSIYIHLYNNILCIYSVYGSSSSRSLSDPTPFTCRVSLMAQLAKNKNCDRLHFRDFKDNEDTAAGKHFPLHLVGDENI